jgi:hypothetical protein
MARSTPGRNPPTDAAARPDDALRLDADQQAHLIAAGFGPDAPPLDFGDPDVRARLVRVLRECGALPPAPRGASGRSRSRRHLRRAG